LFCMIRRVVPVREVATALFTGRIFRMKDEVPEDVTWFIGSMEVGEKRLSVGHSLPADNDYFALRQPKFEIVNPPPTTVRIETEIVHVHSDPSQGPILRDGTIARDPLPSEPPIYGKDGGGRDRSFSLSPIDSTRRFPPIPRPPQPAVLPTVNERWETPPPPYRPDASTNIKEYSVSRAVPSHSHAESFDSVASEGSWMSGSTLLGGKGDVKYDDGSREKN